jgi:hypothetical protein
MAVDDFGPALFQAYSKALAMSIEANAVNSKSNSTEPVESTQPTSAAATGEDGRDWVYAVWRKLDQLNTKLDQQERLFQSLANKPLSHASRGPQAMLTATHSQGYVTGMSGNEALIRSASVEELRHEALHAMKACDKCLRDRGGMVDG